MRSLAVFLLCAASLAAAFDPSKEILARWPEPSGVSLLADAGVTVAIGPATGEFAKACIAAKITPFAELASMDKAAASRARSAGFRGLAVEAPVDQAALRTFLTEVAGFDVLVYLKPQQIAWDLSPGHAVLRHGLWPGVRSGPNVRGRGIEVATASREPWVDANSYLVAYLRSMFPNRAALLGYRPDAAAGLSGGRAVSHETVEVALIEAFVAGGNFILSIPDDYRAALLKSDPKAVAAWQSLGRTVRFLRERGDLFRQPTRSRLAFAAGTLDESGELLNLMYRRNLAPVVVPAAAIPKLDSERFRGLVAANLAAPTGANLARILDFTRAGGILITAGKQPWWTVPDAQKIRSETDRDFYSLGKGQIVAYRAPIADPSEFALDVIDVLGVRTRDLRLWNAGAVAALATSAPNPGKALLHLINYGDRTTNDGDRGGDEFPARIEGVFQKAVLREPGSPEPRPLKAVKRGSATEITVSRLGLLGLIELE